MSRPAAADVLLEVALATPRRLGSAGGRSGRLVAIDGPAGSGKTTLAAALAGVAHDAGLGVTVVATDDVLQGWDGLDELGPRLRTEVVDPLRAGRDGAYRRYDWHARRAAETVVVPLVDLVVLEGVGSGHLGYDDALSALAWVEAPPDLRRARGLARDGEELAASWDAFVPDEDALHERERTRERADLIVDGVSGAVQVPDGVARRPRGPRSAP
ncbi:4-amino-4-deoxy-L-arabinose transferase [Nocardioides sp. HDW12B]|uniref:uridine kinase family protein n=1 Tax=Nocardioides sp. HDW12B TaxID=2714939 RepID=UPI0019800A19|nr:4-amino-4-deoxy-L-arabinose transferase [Nocardioides sp. HDW12B]